MYCVQCYSKYNRPVSSHRAIPPKCPKKEKNSGIHARRVFERPRPTSSPSSQSFARRMFSYAVSIAPSRGSVFPAHGDLRKSVQPAPCFVFRPVVILLSFLLGLLIMSRPGLSYQAREQRKHAPPPFPVQRIVSKSFLSKEEFGDVEQDDKDADDDARQLEDGDLVAGGGHAG